MWQCLMTKEERAQQEAEWAKQLLECRTQFVKHVKLAINTKSPTRRKELYAQWRKDYGDDIARSYARYAEKCIAGTLSIEPIERMIK